jgi:SAM-dependent methyltransferase
MEHYFPSSDAEAVQRELMETVRRQAGKRETDNQAPRQISDQTTIADLRRLRDSTRLVRLTEATVGNVPPEPPTLRGRVGAWMIRKIRRALFWYTPAIVEFHRNVTRAMEEQFAVIEQLLEENTSAREKLAEISADIEQVRLDAAENQRRLSAQDAETRAVAETLQAAIAQISSIAEKTRLDGASQQEAIRGHVRAELSRIEELIQQDIQGVLDEVRPALEQQRLALANAQEAAREAAAAGMTAIRNRVDDAEGRIGETERKVISLRDDVEGRIGETERKVISLRDDVEGRIGETERKVISLRDVVEGRIGETARKMISLRDGLLSQEMRLSVVLEQVRKRLADMGAGQLAILAQEDAHKTDALYLTFEDQFRGTREDIKDRLRVYLPRLKEPGIGSAAMPMVDVGCGRGEWLELLREEGLQARGVDSNRSMLARCRELNLDVRESDALAYLRGLESESLGGVTGFHIIEHLPFLCLMDMLDETVRVLKPGGIAIFETPNPANVLVGAERFYFDPTHRNPLPSPLIRFLAEERGLCRVEVVELHPWPEAYRLPADPSGLAERFNQFFYGPQDYAIIGWKL